MNLINHTAYTQTDYHAQQRGDYLVVPVVMMTPGVRSGSAGSVLHLEEYYSENPDAWDGVPVTAGHPENSNGEFVSVNAVSDDHWVVGHLKDARVEDGKLKADVWIHRQRAIAVNPEVVNYITEGKKLEVSIGAFTRDVQESGEHEGEQYEAVTLEYSPDHLALLPGSRGACSWSDGCGIRNNEKSNQNIMEKTERIEALKEAHRQGDGVFNGLQDNQLGFKAICQKIQSKLDRMDSDIRLHYLKEAYDEYFIYKIRNKDSGEESYYRHDYNITDQEEIEFIGEPTEVRMEVEFVPMQANEDDCGCGGIESKSNINQNGEDIMSDKTKNTQPSGAVQEKVVGLINNERTHFTKSDRSWLLNLNEDQLASLEPKEAPEPEVTREQAIGVLEEDLADIDKVKGLVTNEVAEKIDTGLETYESIREELIESIQSNTSEEDWPEEELQDMETDTLKRLAKTVKPTDYSGMGPVNNNSDGKGGGGKEQPLYPAGVKPE